MELSLLFGDCIEQMQTISNQSVDLILTDLPYGTTICKWDCVIPFEPMWENIWKVLKPNGVVVLFGSEPFSSLLRTSQLQYFKYDWIWEKTRPGNFPMAKKHPLKYHEMLHVFYKGKGAYYPQMVKGNKERYKGTNKGYEGFNKGLDKTEYLNKSYTDFYPKSIQLFSNPNHKSLHPTQKPVPLLEYMIKTYTTEGQVVLDFTMGSGSTGEACLNTNRKFIGIEKDEEYFKVAENRLYNFKKER